VARPLRFAAALVAVVLCVVLVSACGSSGGVPSNDVAVVDGSPITIDALNHWIGIAVNSSATPTATVKRQPAPIPPDFTACVAYERANNPKPAKGQPAPTTASLKTECQQTYTGALNQVMFFLVTADWLQGETAADGIKVSASTVQSQLTQAEEATVAQGEFQSVPALLQYLAAIGETSQDELYRIKIAALSADLSNKAIAAAPKVTAAQISSYYTANKGMFGKPQTRNLRVVLVKKLVSANRVIALLHAGVSFPKVVKQFSIDPDTKSQGGVLDGQTLTGGSLEANLATAVFKAPLNAIEGPVKTSLGYEVFQVQKITPATQETLAQASATISSTLSQEYQKNTSAAFVKKFDAKWLKLTTCKAAYAVATTPPICTNAPKSTTTPATGTTG
jgi:foldase protein PrsA